MVQRARLRFLVDLHPGARQRRHLLIPLLHLGLQAAQQHRDGHGGMLEQQLLELASLRPIQLAHGSHEQERHRRQLVVALIALRKLSKGLLVYRQPFAGLARKCESGVKFVPFVLSPEDGLLMLVAPGRLEGVVLRTSGRRHVGIVEQRLLQRRAVGERHPTWSPVRWALEVARTKLYPLARVSAEGCALLRESVSRRGRGRLVHCA
mmetsp:Transcript_18841/g.48033  ORF Transcript_18841/g.48033 Transcript_18841/m.48033 type:complete len:207 (-) Transcript_18841:390-1010(-)